MEMLCFAVYDQAAHAYMEPFFAPTVELAIRGFRHAVNKPGHPFNDYPEEYTLFLLGSFSQQTGELVGKAPQHISVGVQVVDTGPQLVEPQPQGGNEE